MLPLPGEAPLEVRVLISRYAMEELILGTLHHLQSHEHHMATSRVRPLRTLEGGHSLTVLCFRECFL